MIQALLFDFDGLILDTETTELQSWHELCARYGVRLDVDRWREHLGKPSGSHDMYAWLERECGRPLDREAVRSERRKRNAELNEALRVRPGITDYMAAARAGSLKLAVVSSSHRAWVESHLARLGLRDRFDVLICREDTAKHKPEPEPYLLAAEKLRVAPRAGLVLEDAPNGVRAAKAAGLFCIAVPNPVTRGLPFPGADLVVDELEAVPLSQVLELLRGTPGAQAGGATSP